MDDILNIKNLRKEYKRFTLDNVSFSLPKGYIMGFIGPNGAGKTTVIKLIMNLIKRNGGEIEVFSLDNIQHETDIKKRIGFVYDENYYYEELTVTEVKKIVAVFYDNWDEQRFAEYLKRFDLPPQEKVKNLSKGMKMKFSLALALSHEAELLILDEPASGLDPVARSELLDIIREYMADENRGVLLSSHLTSDLDKIADYICFINRGRIILSASREELLEKYAVVKGEKKLLQGDLANMLVGLRQNDYGFSGLTGNLTQIRSRFGDSVVIERATLEDIMLYTVRGENND